MKKDRHKKVITSICAICKSSDTTEWYKGNADIKKLTFTYEFSPNSKKTFRVVRCNNCSHVFCDPLPKDMYRYYEGVVDKNYLLQEVDRKDTAKSVLKEISKYNKSGILLDIGCATGDFLEVARDQGYSAEGLELSRWSTEIARGKGLKVYSETLESLSKRLAKRYDIVTLWGVIEHFENPYDEMKYINRLLKPKGIIVLWTGDVNGLTSRLFGRNWWYWLDQHIQYFTRKSLNLLGEETGFRQIFSKIYPQAVSYIKVKNSMARYKNNKIPLLGFKLLFAIKKTWFLKLPGEIFWMARKTSDQ